MGTEVSPQQLTFQAVKRETKGGWPPLYQRKLAQEHLDRSPQSEDVEETDYDLPAQLSRTSDTDTKEKGPQWITLLNPLF